MMASALPKAIDLEEALRRALEPRSQKKHQPERSNMNPATEAGKAFDKIEKLRAASRARVENKRAAEEGKLLADERAISAALSPAAREIFENM